MDDGIGGANQLRVVFVREAKLRVGQIAAKYSDPRVYNSFEGSKIHVQLQRPPQSFAGFLLVAGPDQQIQRIGMFGEQVGCNMSADVSGGTCKENGHSLSVRTLLTEPRLRFS